MRHSAWGFVILGLIVLAAALYIRSAPERTAPDTSRDAASRPAPSDNTNNASRTGRTSRTSRAGRTSRDGRTGDMTTEARPGPDDRSAPRRDRSRRGRNIRSGRYPLRNATPGRRGRDAVRTRPENRVISGPAEIIDGDSLTIGAREIRLHGIDAPEGRQDCEGPDGRRYACGNEATRALARLVRGKELNCTVADTDRYGRAVSRCRFDSTDINGWMVENGYAVALPRFTRDYVAAEAKARADRRGLWRGRFQRPSDWRRENR